MTNKKTQTSNLHPKAKHKKHTVLHTKFQELVEFCREFPTLHGSTELQRHVRTSGQAPWHRKCFRLFGPFHRTGSCKILFSSSSRYHLRKSLSSLNAVYKFIIVYTYIISYVTYVSCLDFSCSRSDYTKASGPLYSCRDSPCIEKDRKLKSPARNWHALNTLDESFNVT